MEKDTNNSGFVYILVTTLLVIGAIVIYQLINYNKEEEKIEIRQPEPKIVKEATESTSTTSTKSNAELIVDAFSEKYGKSADDITITVSESTDNHAKGTVSLGEGPGDSGWFLAAKDKKGEWKIVQDGNGTVTCELTDPYNFPTDMVPECY